MFLITTSGEPVCIVIKPVSGPSEALEMIQREMKQDPWGNVKGFLWDGKGEIVTFAEGTHNFTCTGGDLMRIVP